MGNMSTADLVEILLRIARGGAMGSTVLILLKLCGVYEGGWWGAFLPLLGGIHLLLSAGGALAILATLRRLAGR